MGYLNEHGTYSLLKIVGVVVVSMAVAGVLVLLAVGLLRKTPITGQSGFTRVGKPAPEFTLSLFDGDELVLSEFLGQPVVINFWASWCPPCRDEAAILERAWRAYEGKGVLFVGVGVQDTVNEAQSYLEKFDVTYPNGPDHDGTITVDYGVIGLPATFFVERDGVVARRWVGGISESQLVAWVEELLTGELPSSGVEGQNPASSSLTRVARCRAHTRWRGCKPCICHR